MTTDELRAKYELLPCPWCGEKVETISVSEGSTFRWRKVDGCCADGPEVRHDTLAHDQTAAEADSYRRAIEAWNTRANASRDAEVEALQDALFQISVRLKTEREPGMDDMSWHTDMIARAQYLANVEAEVEALRKDAERYRWLRDVGDATWTPLCERMPNYDVDLAIDAAMREEKS